MLEQVFLMLLGIVVGSFIVPYVFQILNSRNRLTALIVEIRYNCVILNRYKESGAGINIVSRTAYEDFRKDYLLARFMVKDKDSRVYDRVHNAYTFQSSRTIEKRPNEWREVLQRFTDADTSLMAHLDKNKPRSLGFLSIFDGKFIDDMSDSLGLVNKQHVDG